MKLPAQLDRWHKRLLPDNPDIGYTPYMWLFYLFFLLPGLYFKQWAILSVGVTILSIIVFLPLYFYGFRLQSQPKLIRNTLMIGLLGIVLMPFNVSSSVYFIYAASGCAFLSNLRHALVIIFGLALVLMLESWYLNFPMPAIFMPTAILLIVACANLFQAALMKKNASLRISQAEVSHLATVAERERISRDLHDLLGHSLSLITLKAELAGKLLARNDIGRAQQEVSDLENISRSALSNVREAVTGYREAGLQDELQHAAEVLQSAGIHLELQVQHQSVPPAYDSTLAMCVREAVTNVIRHANASLCRICLDYVDNQLCLTISDNGQSEQINKLVMGSGLKGMRDRLAAWDGQLEVLTNDGLQLRITLPKNAGDPEADAVATKSIQQTTCNPFAEQS